MTKHAGNKDIDYGWAEKFGPHFIEFVLDRMNANPGCLPLMKMESPIEAKFFVALFCVSRFIEDFVVCESRDFNELSEKYSLVIAPQFKWRNYRSDFCIGGFEFSPILIECDGHDFHERSKEQAARDKTRDAEAQIDGFSIVRFTGSQLHNSAIKCIGTLFDLIASKRKGRAESQKPKPVKESADALV